MAATTSTATTTTNTTSATPRAAVIRGLATALFYDMGSAQVLADYFVYKHMDMRCKGSDMMDDLVRAIMHAQFDMTLVTFNGLATPTSAAMTQVTMLTLFSGHTLAVPLEFVADKQLIVLYEAVTRLTNRDAGFYSQSRYGHTRGEIVLECFNGKRELSALAWPPLLLTLCYRAYVRMLNMAIASKHIDASFARTLVHASTATLRTFIQPDNDMPVGRIDGLTCIPRTILIQQLTRLHASIVGTMDLLVLQRQLEQLSIYFTGYCVPDDSAPVTTPPERD
jgi:hypothetical protein